MMEHRHSKRLHMNLPATIHTVVGHKIAVTISNLSDGGAFLCVPAGHPRLTGLIALTFSLPCRDHRQLRCKAFVVRNQADGVGVMLDERDLEELTPFPEWLEAIPRAYDTKTSASTTGESICN